MTQRLGKRSFSRSVLLLLRERRNKRQHGLQRNSTTNCAARRLPVLACRGQYRHLHRHKGGKPSHWETPLRTFLQRRSLLHVGLWIFGSPSRTSEPRVNELTGRSSVLNFPILIMTAIGLSSGAEGS